MELNICEPYSYVTGNAMALDDLDEEKVNLNYLYFQLMHRGLDDAITGTAQPQITRQNLKYINILLPPISEQTRIANILEKADRLRRLRRYAKKMSDSFLQSAFLEMFGDTIENQKSNYRLGEIVTITGGGTPSRKIKEFYSGSIPWLTSKDMKGEYIFDTEEHITEEAIKRSATKLVKEGSILVVVKSKILMHKLPVAIAMIPLCHGQDVKSIQCPPSILPIFLMYLLKHFEPRLLHLARGVNTEGLTLPMLRELPVPSVQLDKQSKFAKIANMAARLQRMAIESERQIDQLIQTILHKSFTGDL